MLRIKSHWCLIQVDTNALKQQVAERKAAEEQEKQRDLYAPSQPPPIMPQHL